MMTHRIPSGRGARLRRALAMASFALMLLGMVACEDTGTTVPEPVASVQVASPVTSLVAGDSIVLQATPRSMTGVALSGRLVTWLSSDTTVAAVRASGRVVTRKAGSVTITAASEGRTGSVTLTVTPVVQPGPTLTLSALLPAQAYQGDEGVSIILMGQGFDHTSTVLWNGSARPTHRSGTNEIQALIPDTDLVLPGAIQIEVINGDGSRSQALTFTVMVRPMPDRFLALDPSPAVVVMGSSLQMSARYVDGQGTTVPGTPQVAYWSADSTVATVSPTGLVTPRRAGTTRVHAAGGGYATSAPLEVRVAPIGPRVSYQTSQLPMTGQVVDTILWTDGTQPAVKAHLVVRVARLHLNMETGTYLQEFQAYVLVGGLPWGSTGWMESGKAYYYLMGGYVLEPGNGAPVFYAYAGPNGEVHVEQKVRNAATAQSTKYVVIPTPQVP